RVPDDGIEIAADAVAGGLDKAEHGVGGNGGVNGRAAGLEHVQSSLRGERVGRGGGAVGRDDGRAGGDGAAAFGALAGHREGCILARSRGGFRRGGDGRGFQRLGRRLGRLGAGGKGERAGGAGQQSVFHSNPPPPRRVSFGK